MTNTEEKNYYHIYYLNELYNGDPKAILNHIKQKLSKKTNPVYQKRIVLKYLAIINDNANNFLEENLTKIQDRLSENKMFIN